MPQSARMPLPPGTRLGPYEIEAPLGAGGMGEVYRARDTRLNRRLAVKILSSAAADPRRRFLIEAQAASALKHPNIVTVYDVGREGDVDFIAMELVDGESLDRRLANGAIPVGRALAIADQIAAALAQAHAAGIVHRDIKPANILVDRDDRVTIVDFGVAKMTDDARGASLAATVTHVGTRDGSVVGTVAYMSPEQAEGGTVDPRSDIFSFGAVLFELLTGRPVFRRESPLATVAAILHQPAPSVTDIDATIPAGVAHLVARCLRRDPARRFQSATDVQAAIKDLREDIVADATTADPPAPAGTARSSLARALPWSIAAAAVAGAVGVGVLRSKDTPDTPAAAPILSRVTADAGFTADPSLSLDGSMLAYASDRGADNLNIFVQPVAGGMPRQLTADAGDEREPALSPDGSRIAFRSERDGAIYTMASSGTDRPRLLVPDGRRPRFSPDGRFIAYWTGTIVGFFGEAGGYRTFVVPADGGVSREITGFTGARFPVWSPDSRTLLVLASRDANPTGQSYEWWQVPAAGGDPIKTTAHAQFRAAGVFLRIAESFVPPGAWRDGEVVFSDYRNLWAVPLTPGQADAGVPRRLTLGSATDVQAVAGPGVVAFTSYTSATHVWALPIDANRGVATGPITQITEGAGPYGRATVARGDVIAYRAGGPRFPVLVRNLKTGQTIETGIAGSAYGSVISPDGSRIAFEVDGGVSVQAVRGGASRSLCSNCQVGEWTNDSRSVAVATTQSRSGRITLIDAESGASRDLVVSSKNPLNRPHFSPDNRYLAFRAHFSEDQHLKIVRLQGSDPIVEAKWIAVGSGERDLRPAGWSPDGRVLYLLSARDGYRCLYAQRIDPDTGRPEGDAAAVHHFHATRWLTGNETSASTGPSSAIMPGAFLFDQTVLSSNIWTMR